MSCILADVKQNNQALEVPNELYTQNEKIEQVADSTMVVRVDIGSQIHYAKSF